MITPSLSLNDQQNMNRGYQRCPISARVASYPKLYQIFRSASQTMKPALLTFIPRGSLRVFYVAIVGNTKVIQAHLTPSPIDLLSIVAATASETLGSLLVRSCMGVGSRSVPGSGQRYCNESNPGNECRSVQKNTRN